LLRDATKLPLRCLTFELTGAQRWDARPGLVKMYRVPPARAWRPTAGPRLNEGLGLARASQRCLAAADLMGLVRSKGSSDALRWPDLGISGSLTRWWWKPEEDFCIRLSIARCGWQGHSAAKSVPSRGVGGRRQPP